MDRRRQAVPYLLLALLVLAGCAAKEKALPTVDPPPPQVLKAATTVADVAVVRSTAEVLAAAKLTHAKVVLVNVWASG